MNLLEIVQTLHLEAKLPGSSPASVEGQSGRAADLVRWSIDAWNDIQRDKGGRWNWIRAGFQLDTVANTISYAYGTATDVSTAGAITRFRAWDFDPCEPPLIFLVSDGIATQRNLVIAEWQMFRYLYQRGAHTADYPTYISADWLNNLYLGPKPNGVYRVNGNYWRSNQVLALAADEPEMPADYHMLIVYRAIVKYAYNVVGREILARARAEGTPLYDALIGNQFYGLFTLEFPGPLA